MRKDTLVIDNVKLILPDETIDGHIVVENGQIANISSGRTSVKDKTDAQGSFITAGFVEVHTDHMDKCFTPRPKTQWPSWSAMSMHDGIMALSGITTVCDAISIGYVFDGGDRSENLQRMVDALVDGEESGTNRVQHFLHLRCELPSPKTVSLFNQFADIEQLRLVSLMDHAPGQRQFTSLIKFREYYQGKYHLSNSQMAEFEAEQIELSNTWSAKNRQIISTHCRQHNIPLATHDDGTLAHVEEAIAHGCCMAEFPTTLEAAKASHDNNLSVVMGAPNVVRGGSHSGNIAAHELAELGVLNILSSDYYPSSLVDAVFKLAALDDNALSLVDTVKMITQTPAEVLQLTDRGSLEIGKRADLALIHIHDNTPRVEHTYVKGQRIM